MKKTKLFVLALMLGFICSAQTVSLKSITGDTIPVLITYSDTSCHFDAGSVQSIYNSKCMKQDSGYVVYLMYLTEMLDRNKKPLGKNINIWFYKPRP